MTFTNIHNGGGGRDERKAADGYLEPPPVIAALAACFGGPTRGRVSGDRFLIDWGRQRAWPVPLGGCRRSLAVGGSADPQLNELPVPECLRTTVVVAICLQPICAAPRAGGRPLPALEPVSIGRAAVAAVQCACARGRGDLTYVGSSELFFFLASFIKIGIMVKLDSIHKTMHEEMTQGSHYTHP